MPELNGSAGGASSIEQIRGRRFVVTGGAGFIGSHLVDGLLARGAARVAVVDTFFLGREENLAEAIRRHNDKVTIHREDAGDLAAMQSLLAIEHPDVVMNLATKPLPYSFVNPQGACRTSIDIALVLCELLRAGVFAGLLHVSTSEVYGSAQYSPMNERHPLLGGTTYAAGKAAADLIVHSYVEMFHLDAVVVRPFNNYGPRQNEGSLAAVIPETIRRIRSGGAPVVRGDGHQTRDFIFVSDTVDAIIRVLEHPDLRGRIFNIASGSEIPIGELVSTIASLMGYRGEIVYEPERPADVRRHRGDVTALEGFIGPIAKIDLTEGLEQTIEWFTRAQR